MTKLKSSKRQGANNQTEATHNTHCEIRLLYIILQLFSQHLDVSDENSLF